jgi:hypothetical protein
MLPSRCTNHAAVAPTDLSTAAVRSSGISEKATESALAMVVVGAITETLR